MKRIALILSVLVLIFVVSGAGAQEEYTPITRENATEIVQLSRLGNGVPRALVLSNDQMQLAVATTLGVWLADIDDDTSEPVLHEGQGGTWSVSFNPDGSLVAGGGNDGSIMLWNTQTGETIMRLENHLYPISALAWSADGVLLASGDWSGIIRVWDVATWSEYRVFPTSEKIERLIFDGDNLTALSLDTETVWAIADNALLSQNEHTTDLGNNTDVSVGERRVTWISETGTIEVWDKNQRVALFEDFDDVIDGVYFDYGGQLQVHTELGVVSATPPRLQALRAPNLELEVIFGNDGIIRLLNWETQEQIAALYGHIRRVNEVAFSPDGSLLASASDDGTIQIWDVTVTEDSGSLVTLAGHTSGVTSVAFNREDTLIASTGYDGTVRLWGVPQ